MATAAVSSAVQMEAVSPKRLSFIKSTASPSEPTVMIPTTGPKLSSTITLIEWSTSTSTCGAR